MTSRKMYRETARILHDCKGKKHATKEFADFFEKDNPRFDRERFYEAVKSGHDKRKVKRL